MRVHKDQEASTIRRFVNILTVTHTFRLQVFSFQALSLVLLAGHVAPKGNNWADVNGVACLCSMNKTRRWYLYANRIWSSNCLVTPFKPLAHLSWCLHNTQKIRLMSLVHLAKCDVVINSCVTLLVHYYRQLPGNCELPQVTFLGLFWFPRQQNGAQTKTPGGPVKAKARQR